ncbi:MULTISPECIES: hypothetical protein [Mycolicibacter]|uniref:Uncharacterized protein n=2 Tax=Mycolicibacter TaxID=1073531 RepID=A0ABU5XNL1_9MYCO|nr:MULTISPECIES: hypothetical protein [unclassified Mycolicibacter]MEB3023352.1 hypothetical protein [Mycolicibacter sp. MYC098]MEB3033693.1 hypothetical protein [Mycolicibacter sp. MYC340]
MTDFNAPVSDYAGNTLDPDVGPDGDSRFRFEVGEEGTVDIIFCEPLRFHQELADTDHRNIGGAQYRPWSDFVNANGYLTDANSEKLVAELRKMTGVSDIEHEPSAEFEDEPSWAVSIRTDYRQGETIASWHSRIGWPVVAAIVNTTDPGTFNCPYLFSAILYH